jgi:predicted adenine nucleotide alpha hydrolase (AANH) superfamily ATPase
MKLLMHICCAPCSVECVKTLRAEGIEPTGYWFNPNIHPFTEYRARRDTLLEYAKSIGLALETKDFYGLRPFVCAVSADIEGRCAVCYACRMRETARYAAAHGYTHFTTSLLYSPYQKHDLLCLAAEEAADEFGVAFYYRDFRPLYKQGQEETRELNLYMQKYCGCVFSEEERYSKPCQKRLRLAAETGGEALPADGQSARAALRRAGEAYDEAERAYRPKPEKD